ncbi:MAG TPA: hypothetical protein VF765_37330, partial [Polyangiaceae bacterium]
MWGRSAIRPVAVAIAAHLWLGSGAAWAQGGCPDGRQITADTAGHCCWQGQAWNGSRCVGAPASCPAGFQADPQKQDCLMLACPAGKVRKDGVHCCWPGQGYSHARNACIGTPACPKGQEPQGTDDCVPVDKDGDGILNAADKCPDQAEDINHFEDTDGCPDEQKRLALVAAEQERKQREAAVSAIHPLDSLSGARYVGGFGFLVSAPDAGNTPPDSTAGEEPIAVPPGRGLGQTEWDLLLDVGYAHWADPTGQGLYDVAGGTVAIGVRPEFRGVGRWVTVWLDLKAAMGIGGGNFAGGNESVLSFGGQGHVGVDVQPWTFVGLGPFVGYRLDHFSVTPTGDGNGNQSWDATDNGAEFGGHLRLRTRDRPGRPGLLYLDAEIS